MELISRMYYKVLYSLAVFCDLFPSSKRESDATLSAPLNVTIREIEVNSAVVTWEILEGDPVIGFAVTQQVPTHGLRLSLIFGVLGFSFIHENLQDRGLNPKFIFKIKDGLIFTAPYQRSGAACRCW